MKYFAPLNDATAILSNVVALVDVVVNVPDDKSRFANEGNNLFGIRTYDEDGEWLLPIPWTKWPGWGVKKYNTRCESVMDYVRIINELWAYEELRKVRDNNGDVFEMADQLNNYAKNPNYTILVKAIIKT